MAATVKAVTLVWIPAHKGHEGNEKADELAKRGSRATERELLLDVQQPRATIKAAIRDHMYARWGDEWINSGVANHTKSFYERPNKSKARFVYKLARLELGRFVRIITGHNNLGFFQTKIGLAREAKCRFCGYGDETVTHFLTFCPRLRGWSMDVFGGNTPTNNMTWSVRNLLNFSYHPSINEAYEGTWADGDPPPEVGLGADESFELGWLETSQEYDADQAT